MALPELKVMGDPNNHDPQTHTIILGKADFVDDHLPGGKLFAAGKHATITHGTIVSIDTSAAMALTGVKGIITYEDAPNLFSQEILYWGQPVAAIAADDWYTAQRAINLIDVTYEELPAVIDPDDPRVDTVLSGRRADSNWAESTFDRGDITVGMAESPVQFEHTTGWTTTYQHSPVEQYSALAYWDGDHVYVYQSSQNLHGNKNAVVNYLEMPANKVHVYARYCGGGHGARLSNWESGVAAVMSRKLGGVPVSFKMTKKHSMLFSIRQHDHKAIYKLGAKEDGSIMAADVQYWTNGTGASINTTFRTTWNIPHVRWRGQGAYINVPNRGAWRCVSDPPHAANWSKAFTALAAEIDMNPYELLKKNILPEDAPDLDPPNRYFGCKEEEEILDTVAEASGFNNKWHRPAENNVMADGRLHGIGIHCHHDSHGSVNGQSYGGIIMMQPDGTALVSNGNTKPHNAPTEMRHIVAEAMGMKYDDVITGSWGDTDTTQPSGSHGGSANTGRAGSVFVRTAEDCLAKLFAAAITKAPLRDIAGITVDDLASENSEIFYKPDPTQRITFRQAMSGTPPITGVGNGWRSDRDTPGDGLQRELNGLPVGTAVTCSSAAGAVAEVAVDPETGEVEILGYWNGVGTGRIVFYHGVMSQLGAGIEQQLNQALYYGDIYDPLTGAVVGSQYTEAQLLTTMDMKPSRHHLYPIEGDDYGAPLGAHGIGEPCVGSYVAILNAIYNATGVWVDQDHGAHNPDRILKALGKA